MRDIDIWGEGEEGGPQHVTITQTMGKMVMLHLFYVIQAQMFVLWFGYLIQWEYLWIWIHLNGFINCNF
jgi:L-asparagine transporter-like permease